MHFVILYVLFRLFSNRQNETDDFRALQLCEEKNEMKRIMWQKTEEIVGNDDVEERCIGQRQCHQVYKLL